MLPNIIVLKNFAKVTEKDSHKKEGAWTVWRFKKGLGKKDGGGGFDGGWYPDAHYVKQRKRNIVYPNLQSAICQVEHSKNLPLPKPPDQEM